MSINKILDLSSLEDASHQLKSAIEFSESDLAKTDLKIFELFRTSTIQCFEYTYELSVKSIRRFLEMTIDSPSQVDEWDFKDLMREAATRGVITDPKDWFEFRRLRNTSSHAYSRLKAEEVYSKASALLEAAERLAIELRRKGIAK